VLCKAAVVTFDSCNELVIIRLYYTCNYIVVGQFAMKWRLLLLPKGKGSNASGNEFLWIGIQT